MIDLLCFMKGTLGMFTGLHLRLTSRTSMSSHNTSLQGSGSVKQGALDGDSVC